MRAAMGLRSVSKAAAGLVGTPFTDNFAFFDDSAKWTGSYGSTYPTVVSGRARVACISSYANVGSAKRFDLTATPVWVQIPTVPTVGNGTKQTQFSVTGTGGQAAFQIQGSPIGVYMNGSGGITGTTSVTYSSTSHQWLRFSISGGNLLWEASPDGVTWTTLRSAAAPSWATSTLVSVEMNSGYYGTETAGTYAEFDNFRL